ncbi:MAG TPA: alpha-E domain-containing protein [Polyangiaceae bacterium]|nr:alpha-E domain-containing protein [Polyangiaceae bacterium]
MLSRVAEAIYWMGRYVERAENVARFVDVALQLAIDLPSEEQWEALVATTGDGADFAARYGEATKGRVLAFLAFDGQNPNSIVSCVRSARENARSVREIISSEMWEQLNRAYLTVTDEGAERLARDAPHEFFTEVKLASHLFVGTTYLTMTHNEAWHFARLGRVLERADKTSRILDVKYFLLLPEPSYVGSAVDEVQWAAVLRSASAFEMYRKARGRIDPHGVVDFLLRDELFPRSVRRCLGNAMGSLRTIQGRTATLTPAERELGRAHALVQYADTAEVLAGGLHEYTDRLQTAMNRAGQAIHETFFAAHPEDESAPPPSAPPSGLPPAPPSAPPSGYVPEE